MVSIGGPLYKVTRVLVTVTWQCDLLVTMARTGEQRHRDRQEGLRGPTAHDGGEAARHPRPRPLAPNPPEAGQQWQLN